MVNNSNPPTAEHVGLASWTARRQFADGRQNSRLSTPGLAGDERDGEEQDGPGPPYQPKPTAESHLVLPVVTEQAESHLVWPVVTELATTHPVLPVASEPQCAPGTAGATAESLPCPGDGRPNLLCLASSNDGEVAATGHCPASLPLRHPPSTHPVLPVAPEPQRAPGIAGAMANGLAEAAVKRIKLILDRHTRLHSNWPAVLPMAQFLLNSRSHTAHGISPFTALFGRSPAPLAAIENPELLPSEVDGD